MIMDCAKYAGLCVCGREHTLETKKVVVEDNMVVVEVIKVEMVVNKPSFIANLFLILFFNKLY